VAAAHPEHEQAGDAGPQLARGPQLADGAGAREHGQVDEAEHGDRGHGQREGRGQAVQHGRRPDQQQGRDQQPAPAQAGGQRGRGQGGQDGSDALGGDQGRGPGGALVEHLDGHGRDQPDERRHQEGGGQQQQQGGADARVAAGRAHALGDRPQHPPPLAVGPGHGRDADQGE
jgi:hypothetical protein